MVQSLVSIEIYLTLIEKVGMAHFISKLDMWDQVTP